MLSIKKSLMLLATLPIAGRGKPNRFFLSLILPNPASGDQSFAALSKKGYRGKSGSVLQLNFIE